MFHFWKSGNRNVKICFLFQLVAFLFSPIILPVYFVLLPFIGCVLCCRRRCGRKSASVPTIRSLCQSLWQQESRNGEFDPEVLNRLTEVVERQLETHLAAYFHRMSLEDQGATGFNRNPPNLMTETLGSFGRDGLSYVALKGKETVTGDEEF